MNPSPNFSLLCPSVAGKGEWADFMGAWSLASVTPRQFVHPALCIKGWKSSSVLGLHRWGMAVLHIREPLPPQRRCWNFHALLFLLLPSTPPVPHHHHLCSSGIHISGQVRNGFSWPLPPQKNKLLFRADFFLSHIPMPLKCLTLTLAMERWSSGESPTAVRNHPFHWEWHFPC